MKQKFWVIIPLVVLFSLIGWRIGQKRAEITDQNASRSAKMKSSPTVVVAPAQVRDIVHTYDSTGSVEAPLNVNIAAKVTGRIEALPFREGDRIKKGQILVKIDPSEVEGEVQQAMAGLAEAQYRLAQAKLNQGPNNTSVDTQIRQQKASVASANADYNQVRVNYDAQLASANANVLDTESRVENAKASVDAAKANLDNATSRYNRLLDLYKKGYIAAQDVDDAKTDVSSKQAALAITRGQLKSANAVKESAQQQANIAKTKGKADIEASHAKLVQAQASLEYASSNSVQTSAYKESLSALRSSVAAAQASLDSTKARRADTVIKSPLDGFVTGRNVDPGAVATPGQTILTVQFMKQVWVTVSVPEEICPKLHIGQPATVTLDAFPEKSFTASVIQINPSADMQSRQFMVRAILSNSDGLLKPGMFARVSFETDRVKSAIAIPREAVQHDKMGDYVMAVNAGKADRLPVIMGIDDAGFISIKQGIKLGDKVIVMSAFPVRPGMPVSLGGMKGKKGGTKGGWSK